MTETKSMNLLRPVKIFPPTTDGATWTVAIYDTELDESEEDVVVEIRARYPGCGIRLIPFSYLDWAHLTDRELKRGMKRAAQMDECTLEICRRVLWHRGRIAMMT